MAGKVKNYFAGGNTARGFFSIYNSCLENLNKTYILLGAPGTGKSTLIKDIGTIWNEKGYDVEYLHSSSNNQSIEGVIIPKLKTGIVDGTAAKNIELKAFGAIEEYVNLGEGLDTEKLARQKENIIKLNKAISESFQRAYDTFAEALQVHDDWEKIYIQSMDFQKADQLTEKLLQAFFGKMNLNKIPEIKRRFLGAATPKGAVDFVPNLTEGLSKRYFLKGRPGSGKSTMLKKLVAEGEKRGFDLEIYHCGFDPHSLDMMIIRELGLAIFDSTAPHEYFPSRDGDEIIDLYGTVIEEGTDEIFADKIEVISVQYKENMKKAISYLTEAKSQHDELEKIYTEAMDFAVVNHFKEKIDGDIQMISEREKGK